jgi:hypothetical protein
LSEFAIEGFERRDSKQPLTELPTAIGVLSDQDVAIGTRRKSRDLWAIGTAMLMAGLLAGFAAGVTVNVRTGEAETEPGGSLVEDEGNSRPQHDEVQATTGQPATEPIAPAIQETLPASEGDNRVTTPVSIESQQPSSKSRVQTVPADASGVLHVDSRPAGAQVYLDGQLVSTTPFQLSGVTPGPHTIHIALPGYLTWSAPVDVEPGSRVRIAASLEQ